CVGDAGVCETAPQGAAVASDHSPHVCERAALCPLDPPEGQALPSWMSHGRYQAARGTGTGVERVEPRGRVAGVECSADVARAPGTWDRSRRAGSRGDRGALGLRPACLRAAESQPRAVYGAWVYQRVD